MRTRKSILDRKDAKRVLELLNQGMNPTQIAKVTGLWRNRVVYLVTELNKLDSAEITPDTVDYLSKFTGKYADMMRSEFSKDLVQTSDLVKLSGLSRINQEMKNNIKLLLDNNIFEIVKVGTKINYKRVN